MARSARRLWNDERGLGAIELVVVLVLIVALAVSFWNLFGNDLACSFSDAIVSFDDPTHRASTQCVDATSSGKSGATASSATSGRSSGGRSATGGASHTSSSGHTNGTVSTGASPPSSPSAPGVPASVSGPQPVASPAASPPPSSPSAPSAPVEPSLGQRVASAAASVGEHIVDFTEGAIAGANPLTPLVPVELKPTFGHEVTFGLGEVTGSVAGLLEDASNIMAGGSGVVASGAVMVASDGTLIPVALPAMAASGTLAAAGVAGAAGHGTNLVEGIRDVVHGDNSPARPSEGSQGGSSSAEKPPANSDSPAGGERPASGEHAPAGEKPGSSPERTPSNEGPTKDPGGGDPASPSAGKGTPGAPRQVGGFEPKPPSELGVTVRPDGKEVYYRTMSKADYEALKSGRKVPATGETSTSPTRSFSESYDGVLVEFEMKPGTTAKLQEVGVSDGSPLTSQKLPDMPTGKEAGGKWPQKYARFKEEGGQINIQLGRGKGLETFNENIGSFREIPR